MEGVAGAGGAGGGGAPARSAAASPLPPAAAAAVYIVDPAPELEAAEREFACTHEGCAGAFSSSLHLASHMASHDSASQLGEA